MKPSCGDEAVLRQKKPSEMTIAEYLIYRKHKKLNTVTDWDNQMVRLVAMTEDVLSDDPDKQLDATGLFRNILEIGPNRPFQQVIDAGVVKRFVQFLYWHDFPSLQIEAVYILGMFFDSSEHVSIIAQHGAVGGFANLIPAPYLGVLVIFTLGRIVVNYPQLRELVLRSRGLELLLYQIKENNMYNMLPIAVQTLHLLCCGNPPLNSKKSGQVFSVLQQLLLPSNNEDVIAYACRILCDLSYGRIDVHGGIMSGVCYKLLEMLNHHSPTVILPAIMTVASIVRCKEVLAQNEYLRGLVIQSMILPERLQRLKMLLVDGYDDNIKKAACQIVFDITRDNRQHIQEVIHHGIITALTHVYRNSNDDIKMEVATAILCVTCFGTHDDIRRVGAACIEPLCGMLEDPLLGLSCLIGLQKILLISEEDFNKWKSSNLFYYTKLIADFKGLQKIINHRNHGRGFVRSTAWSILRRYWPHVR